ncbi:NAD(P)/FAD-dependent oxidoreductase [Actinacidiphila sp. ITFR-21]|uniref:NAD(P)/FAD-dependent oxidoreductase n=1 Tax=Actinacidiphila sp. ITFR-21 TaxID=3075199 RepID=UPI00288C429F|nr:FAD-dependent oxidoreductase [Streptomyces sp. ITFR-21]WNI18326.1 FAD-dependent oxidoreductase [Streptomyces sp. ITFR-21]
MDPARSLAAAEPAPYWLDDPGRPAAEPALAGAEQCDLLVVGGGYSGLWTALLAKERDPGRDVVLIEADRIGWAASGRNGGFCAASITHGPLNGLARWPAEFDLLQELGDRNLDAIEETVARYGLDCDFERTGGIDVATADHQWDELRALHRTVTGHNVGLKLLDRDQLRAEVDSPTFLGGLYDERGVALVHPAKLAWALKATAARLGVRVYERTPATALTRRGGALAVRTPYGAVSARQVALGTGVFPSLIRRVRAYTVPVYDYALMTEPLTADQRAAIGWRGRQGLADTANRFHYFRLTADNRILWGGYDAVYPRGGRISAAYDHRPQTYLRLARHFFGCFPQLEGLRFSHSWGGVIDTCTRFSPFFGTAHGGRVAYTAGYTGLGVGATRFGAEVMLDLLAGTPTERTGPEMVRRRPLPFPPEPFASAGIGLTQWSLARADDSGGRRNLWLRALDRAGLGFDS